MGKTWGNERVLLVDFDWGDKDVETVYPRWDLNKMRGLIMAETTTSTVTLPICYSHCGSRVYNTYLIASRSVPVK